MINEKKKITFFDYPFPYIKIDNFLEKNFFSSLENNFPKIADFKKNTRTVNRMDFDTTFDDNLYIKLISEIDEYQKFHNYVYSNEFINYFLNLFKDSINKEFLNKNIIDNILNYKTRPEPFEVGKIIGKKDLKRNDGKFLYPRLDIGAGIEGYGKKNGGGGIHIDNPQRLISMLFYVGGYKKIIGGEHRVWKKVKNKDVLEIHDSIKPEKNILIISLQNDRAFHDVNPINSIDGSRNAFYMAISSNVKIWKKVKRNKFNIKFNRNRVDLNVFEKLKNLLKNLRF